MYTFISLFVCFSTYTDYQHSFLTCQSIVSIVCTKPKLDLGLLFVINGRRFPQRHQVQGDLLSLCFLCKQPPSFCVHHYTKPPVFHQSMSKYCSPDFFKSVNNVCFLPHCFAVRRHTGNPKRKDKSGGYKHILHFSIFHIFVLTEVQRFFKTSDLLFFE